MWDSYDQPKRMIMSILTIAVVVFLIVFSMFIGWTTSNRNSDNRTKAYMACVQHHLPAECK